ncbi:hypothetical protein SAMN05421690_100871 [Nitrosomonas sp. Nm51]|nr:hypothetical protein SAMN05421690_100871 [Nitrosomonas sp. Nm51]
MVLMTKHWSINYPMERNPDSNTVCSHFMYVIVPALGFWLTLMATPTQADCEGCLCPGDPCRLCPLPAVEGEPPKADEHAICTRIRARVPPTSAEPGSNEYFPSLDRSIAACVAEGGDVIRNRQRGKEFPSRFYCKPLVQIQAR